MRGETFESGLLPMQYNNARAITNGNGNRDNGQVREKAFPESGRIHDRRHVAPATNRGWTDSIPFVKLIAIPYSPGPKVKTLKGMKKGASLHIALAYSGKRNGLLVVMGCSQNLTEVRVLCFGPISTAPNGRGAVRPARRIR